MKASCGLCFFLNEAEQVCTGVVAICSNKFSESNRLYSEMGCIGMEIKILQQGEARRRSIAISYATDEERRLATKDNLAPYKLFQIKSNVQDIKQ